MPTLMQRRAVDKIVEKSGNNKKISISGIMREVGYSPESAKDPSKLFNSKGFKEILDEIGLTPGFVTRALKEDIDKKPQRRLGELTLASDLMGLRKQEQNFNVFFPTQIVIKELNGASS